MSDDLNNNDFIMFNNKSTSKLQKDLELKIDWFIHVLNSLEKLADKYVELNNKVHNSKSSLTSDIISVREYIYIELKNLRKDFGVCKDACHNSFDTIKNKLDAKVEKVIIKIDHEKEKIEDKILADLDNKLEKLNNRVDKMNDIITTVRIKIATIGALGGIFGSVSLFLIQIIAKKYF